MKIELRNTGGDLFEFSLKFLLEVLLFKLKESLSVKLVVVLVVTVELSNCVELVESCACGRAYSLLLSHQ